jgi:tetratricopeptide (TPR) repeat protein
MGRRLPPAGQNGQKRASPWSGASAVALSGIVFLAIVALGVVFVLPEIVETVSTNSTPPPSQQTKVPVATPSRSPSNEKSEPPVGSRPREEQKRKLVPTGAPAAKPATPARPQPVARIDPIKEKAEKVLSYVLRRQARLENEGVRVWGKPPLKTSYPEIQTVLEQANKKFDRQEYETALDRLQKATTLLYQLAASKDERFRRAMDAGEAALLKNDSDEGVKQYRLALAIRPSDQQATAGVVRAEKLPQILAKMTTGQQYENDGNLDDALKAYMAAKSLDATYAPATQSAQRVAALVKQRDYRNALSKAIAAMNRSDFSGAERYLDTAASLSPNTPEIQDLRGRVHVAKQFAALKRLQVKARNFEKQEQWHKAITIYDRALAMDQSTGFAVLGKARAAKRAYLQDEMDFYLKQPHRLWSPEPLSRARQLLEAADAARDAGPRFRQSRDRLRHAISQASIPRTVLLMSDGLTQITINRVGRFGAFRKKQLTLLPGDYIAVGSRAGYRDVRIRFRVIPADTDIIVKIKCTDRI